MSNNKLGSRPQQPQQPQITPEMLDRLLSIQEAELTNRTAELEIRRLEVEKTHEFSSEGLNAQLTDRENERKLKKKSQDSQFYFIGFITLIVVIFLCFALWTNKDQIALEIVKGAVLVSAGYLGGKYHQKTKEEKPKTD